MQKNIIHILKNFISAEYVRIRESLPDASQLNFDSRIPILELTRSIDYVYSRPLITKQSNDRYIYNSYKAGGPCSLGLFIDGSTKKEFIPFYPTKIETEKWANSCIQHSGRLIFLNNLLEVSHDKITSFECISENYYKILLKSKDADIEAFDVSDQEWLRYFVSKQDSESVKHLNDQTKFITSKMEKLVHPWREYFIGYDTTPEIDDHFEKAGIFWARTLDGQFELNGEAEIGGYPYYAYRAAIGLMCGRALKHLQYASILSDKYLDLNIRNLLTIWCDKLQLKEYFCSCLEIDSNMAKSLIRALTLDEEYVNNFRCVASAPLPPFIQIGNNHLLMSIAGCLSAPFWFVLRKLRNDFRKDWDKIVGDREKMFRDDLYMVLSLPYIQKIQKTVRIRYHQKELTDIDAVVYDEKNNVLVLFQLKWQDPHGNSMRERRSRMKNLISEANQWVSTIHDWINNIPQETMISLLGLKLTSNQRKIDTIKLIVLARHQVRFTMSEPLSSDAVWGTWPQFCRLITEEADQGNILNSVINELQKEQCRSQSPRFYKNNDAIKIGKMKFEIQII